jgi:hypothetical protein
MAVRRISLADGRPGLINVDGFRRAVKAVLGVQVALDQRTIEAQPAIPASQMHVKPVPATVVGEIAG